MIKVPITQSEAWQKLQDALGEESFFEKSDDGDYQYLAINRHTPVGNYLYLPYGPVAKDKAAFQRALASLERLAAKHRAIFTRIEPQLAGAENYLPPIAKKVKDISPAETWLLDLTGSPEALKSRLPARLLRYYKHHQEKGITIETSHDPADIHHLVELQRALARNKHIGTFSEHYLATELAQPFATLYLVKYQDPAIISSNTGRVTATEEDPRLPAASARIAGGGGGGRTRPVSDSKVIAAGLVFDDATTRYNIQGAQSEQGRKLHATGILTIQLILDAASNHQQTFDFWGIAPSTPVTPQTPAGLDPSHPWAGFTAFKKTFAGHEVTYAGTYDLVRQPMKYRLYQSLRRLHSRH